MKQNRYGDNFPKEMGRFHHRKHRSAGGAMNGIADATDIAAPMIGQALGGNIGSGIGGMASSAMRGLAGLANGQDATETMRQTGSDMGSQVPALLGTALGGPIGGLAGSLYLPAVTALASAMPDSYHEQNAKIARRLGRR